MSDILIVIEDSGLRENVSRAMLMDGYRISEADCCGSGLERLRQASFDVVIFTLKSAKIDGLNLLKETKRVNAGTSLIGISNNGPSAASVAAMSAGAHAILQNPFNMEELQIQVKRAIEHTSLMQEVAYLRHAQPNVVYNFDNIISKSEKVREIFSVLERIAKTDAPVVIYGEPGTGKELIGGAIHYNSLRRKNNLIKVNCATLPEKFLESELFGHEAGAFAEASKQRIGRFEQANHGTLFLKQVSSLSLPIQAKLLEFVRKKTIRRLGSSQTIKLDVRLILASEQNLKEEARAGRFDDKLYWPLHLVPIDIPPLRQRKCDIPVLADYFLKYYSRELNKKITGFERDVKKTMLNYRWPGNVRELKNIIERAVLRAEQETVSLSDMAFPFTNDKGNSKFHLPPSGLSLYEMEKNTVLQALQTADWVQKDAARLLGISKRSLNYKIENFQIKNPKWIKNK